MADLVHVTPERNTRRITRHGLSARSRGWSGERGVFAMPVLPSFTLTHQWVRELRRRHPGVFVAVQLRLPDDEPVTVGRYGTQPRAMTAAQATDLIRELADPRGYEVFVPRGIAAGELRRIRHIPQSVGWPRSWSIWPTIPTPRCVTCWRTCWSPTAAEPPASCASGSSPRCATTGPRRCADSASAPSRRSPAVWLDR